MSAYSFRPVTPAALPLLCEWRCRPHRVDWWGPADEAIAWFTEKRWALVAPPGAGDNAAKGD